jgi:hypothetical protein
MSASLDRRIAKLEVSRSEPGISVVGPVVPGRAGLRGDRPPVDHVIPRVPVRQWVLAFPIPLRLLFAAHPHLLSSVLQIVHRVIATFLIKQAGLKRTYPSMLVLLGNPRGSYDQECPPISGRLPDDLVARADHRGVTKGACVTVQASTI